MSTPRNSAYSLEASLDEENREVLATLRKQSRSRSPNPKVARGTTPPPPIRSMLDINDGSPRHGSIAGMGVGVTSPRDQRKASKRLNPADPSTWTRPHRPSSPGPGRPSFDNQPKMQEIPVIQVDSGDTAKGELDSDANAAGGVGDNLGTTISFPDTHQSSSTSVPQHPSDENQKPADAPDARNITPQRQSRLDAESTKEKKNSASEHSPHRRRSSNKSSSFSDFSDVPGDTISGTTNGNEEALVESSDEERRESSSDAESPQAHRGRGRDKASRSENSDTTSQALLAPQSRGVRSLLEPSISPSRSTERDSSTSFGRSGPNLSDFEQDPMEADIQKAKTLGLNISPVDDSIVDRHVRMIIRGEWGKLQDEAEDSNHRSRLYLTCSDLSTEASYALEWTVGTMLRDGDTLLAMYAIEDETAPKETEGNREVMAESAKAAHDASETMATLTRQTTNLSHTTERVSKFVPATEAGMLTGSVNATGRNKKELERLRAMDEITQNFLKLVRKTPLQVRCMVEVIHCKSPKHLILNAIDELEPTLCVVGTRGRSSLKGVLLGSFSNYLVTKSSVPVMVARKRLKKSRHAKVNSANIRLSNNLTNSIMPRQRKSLTQARID